MSKILKVRSVNDYGRYLGAEEQHPFVSVIDYAEVSPVRHRLNDKCPTASASNTPSTSAGCSRSKRASRRQSTANGCGAKKLF